MRLQLNKMNNGSWSCFDNAYKYVLSRYFLTDGGIMPKGEAEYMIVGTLGINPIGLIVEPVSQNHRLIRHSGFECIGGMCRTMARSVDGKMWLTPGRLHDLLPIAENVNADFCGQPKTPLTPGAVYILEGENRVSGIPDIHGIDKEKWKATIAHKKRILDMQKNHASDDHGK